MCENRFNHVTKGMILCRAVENMTPLEKQFYEGVVNEVTLSKPMTLTNHAEHQRKKRNVSIPKLRFVWFEGELQEIQFDDTGVKAILSHATLGQFRKGFATNIVVDLLDGKIISVWNREFQHDAVKSGETYIGEKNYILAPHENTLDLFAKFTDLGVMNEPTTFIGFLRKYGGYFNEKQENKISNFLKGKTLITQL